MSRKDAAEATITLQLYKYFKKRASGSQFSGSSQLRGDGVIAERLKGSTNGNSLAKDTASSNELAGEALPTQFEQAKERAKQAKPASQPATSKQSASKLDLSKYEKVLKRPSKEEAEAFLKQTLGAAQIEKPKRKSKRYMEKAKVTL